MGFLPIWYTNIYSSCMACSHFRLNIKSLNPSKSMTARQSTRFWWEMRQFYLFKNLKDFRASLCEQCR